jgi:hypothetical protein
MTMVELIVSFALTAIIAFFLTEVVLFLRQAYVGNGIKTELISKQTLISTKINDLFNSKRIKEAKDCGDGCVELTFDDNSIEQISFNSNTNLVSIGGYVVKLPESAVIGTTAIDTTSLENNDKFNSIFQIYVPITSKLLNGKNFDVNIIYQYNKNTEDWSYNSSVKTYHIASPTQTLITQGETLNLLNGISFIDGKSLVPILKNPKSKVNKYAFGQYNRGKINGYSCRDSRYRLVEWIKDFRTYAPLKGKQIVGVELYDYQTDPLETNNVANKPEYKKIVERMTKDLHTHFQKQYEKSKLFEISKLFPVAEVNLDDFDNFM